MSELRPYTWDFPQYQAKQKQRWLIMQRVCDLFGITATQMRSTSKKSEIFHARMVYAYLVRKHLKDTVVRIGEDLNRDHSSVCSMIMRMEDFIFTKDVIAKDTKMIELELFKL